MGIADSLRKITPEDIPGKIPSEDFKFLFEEELFKKKTTQKIDLSKITNTGDFKINYNSKIPKTDRYNSKTNHFSGILSISRIYFNPDRTVGFFHCSYWYWKTEGHGEFVFIRKKNGKWQIEKITSHWIT